jgi:hypothetical protein
MMSIEAFDRVEISNLNMFKILQQLKDLCDTPDEAFGTLVAVFKSLRDTQVPKMTDNELVMAFEVALASTRENALQ